jgi:hypothetical protein
MAGDVRAVVKRVLQRAAADTLREFLDEQVSAAVRPLAGVGRRKMLVSFGFTVNAYLTQGRPSGARQARASCAQSQQARVPDRCRYQRPRSRAARVKAEAKERARLRRRALGA